MLYLLLSGLLLFSEGYIERIEKEFTFVEQQTLSVVGLGDVQIQGWDKPNLRFELEKRATSRDLLNKIEVNTNSKKDGLKISIEYIPSLTTTISRWNTERKEENSTTIQHDSANVSCKIFVNRNANVYIENRGGSIRIENIRNKIQILVVDGEVDIDNCCGAISIETVNGSIKSEFTEVGRIDFSTINGDIILIVPDKTQGIYVEVSQGKIYSDFPLASYKGEKAIKLKAKKGDIFIHKTHSLIRQIKN